MVNLFFNILLVLNFKLFPKITYTNKPNGNSKTNNPQKIKDFGVFFSYITIMHNENNWNNKKMIKNVLLNIFFFGLYAA